MLLTDLPARNSIKCGKFYIPTSSISARLCQYVRAVLLEDLDPSMTGYIGRTGSATLLRLRDKNYICLTKHELKIKDEEWSKLDNVRIVSGYGGVLENILFGSVIFQNSPDLKQEEFDDLIFLKALLQESDSNPDYTHYFPVRKFDSEKIIASLMVGCPIHGRNFTFNEETGISEKFNMVSTVRDCWLDKSFRSHAKYFERFTYEQKPDFPEDGLSGGAVFSIIKNGADYEVHLHGVITRAGNGSLYVVNSDYLLMLREGV